MFIAKLIADKIIPFLPIAGGMERGWGEAALFSN